MHDHLRDMGRDLAEKEPPHCQRRLWHPTYNLLNLSDQSHVRGINMAPEWPPRLFEKLAEHMSSVQLVRAEGDSVQSIFSAAQTPQLIWLRWDKCPYPSLPSWIPLENLRVLQIEGDEFKMIWTHESQVPVQIRELHIDSSVSNIPKSIGMLKHLEKFVLRNAKYDTTGLRTLPEEFGDLQSLKHLELSGKSEIEWLPESFGKLTNLQTINLSYCSSLQMLPDSFGNLVNLQTIDLPYCSSLQMLPDSFGNLVNLQTIDLSYCSRLQMLPDSFGNLVNLQTIDLSYCSRLQMLPDSFGNLVNLQTIHLSNCSHLHMLPDSFHNLVNLQTIHLSNCSHLHMLPDSFHNLANLTTIDLSGCSHLQRLPDSLGNLANIQTIDLSGCSHLQMLPDSLGNLANIQTIDLSGCSHLQMLPDSLGNLHNIQTIDLSGCSHLQMLPVSFSNLLPNLRSMKLLDTGLKELPSALEYFSNLKILHLGSKSLEIPSFSFPRSLEELELHFCHGFKCLPDSIGRLTQLRKLIIKEMNTLEVFKIEDCQPSDPPFIKDGAEIETFSNCEDVFPNLQYVEIVDCNSLVEVGALPTTLITLDLRGCGALRKIGELSGLSKLQRLNIWGCMELEELPSIETLVLQHVQLRGTCNALVEVGALPPTLITLDLRGCGALRKIGELSGLSKLRTLSIWACMELEELPSIETLVSLRYLYAIGCVKLKRIRGLLQCPQLWYLNVRRCSELEEVEGVEHCTWLQDIDVSGCHKLQCPVWEQWEMSDDPKIYCYQRSQLSFLKFKGYDFHHQSDLCSI